MRGHIRARGNGWQLKFEGDRDPVTGKRNIQYVQFTGTKREANAKLAELLNAVNTGKSGRVMYVPVVVALFTGLRRGELLALKWKHVDLDQRVIQIRESIEETRRGLALKGPKTVSGVRDVTLPDIVVVALREHRRGQLETRMALGAGKLSGEAFVFSRVNGELLSPRSFSAQWADSARALGLGQIGWQALRHTHASLLAAAGLSVVEIGKRLGHAGPEVTLRTYLHLFDRRDAGKLAGQINAAIAAVIG